MSAWKSKLYKQFIKISFNNSRKTSENAWNRLGQGSKLCECFHEAQGRANDTPAWEEFKNLKVENIFNESFVKKNLNANFLGWPTTVSRQPTDIDIIC